MERVKSDAKNGDILNAVNSRLGNGKNEMYAVRDKKRNAIPDEILIPSEEFDTDLYCSSDIQIIVIEEVSIEEIDIPPVRTKEAR